MQVTTMKTLTNKSTHEVELEQDQVEGLKLMREQASSDVASTAAEAAATEWSRLRSVCTAASASQRNLALRRGAGVLALARLQENSADEIGTRSEPRDGASCRIGRQGLWPSRRSTPHAFLAPGSGDDDGGGDTWLSPGVFVSALVRTRGRGRSRGQPRAPFVLPRFHNDLRNNSLSEATNLSLSILCYLRGAELGRTKTDHHCMDESSIKRHLPSTVSRSRPITFRGRPFVGCA